jgi:subtilisin family serine protease
MLKRLFSLMLLAIVVFALSPIKSAKASESIIEHAPNGIIVKLKDGKSLESIQELNRKHKIKSIKKVFKKRPDRKKLKENLTKKLNQKLAPHDKQKLEKRLAAVDKEITRIERRNSRAPNWSISPNLDNIYLLEPEADLDLLTVLKDYQTDQNVEYAEPDFAVQEDVIPNDYYWNYYMSSWGHNYLYGMENVSAPQAWDISAGRPDVIVAPIESGIEIVHEDLAANIWVNSGEVPDNGFDDDANGYVDDYNGVYFSSGTSYSTTIPTSPHGTHVSGTVAASGNNGIGVIGLAWQSKIMPAVSYPTTSARAAAIVYAADNGADVITNSWSMITTSQIINDAIAYAHSQGCVIIASAGNNNSETLSQTPAQIPSVITVAAVDHLDHKASFSNYGVKIDVTAPGVVIGSTAMPNSYGGMSGTSMAAPHVAAQAALIISKNLDLYESSPGTYPLLTNEEIRQIIRKSADDLIDPLGNGGNYPGFDIFSGYGRSNAYKGLQITTACEATILEPKVNQIAYNFDFDIGEKSYFNGWTIVSGSIDIKGAARGKNFKEYRIEYGQGVHPNSWTLLHSSSTPVEGTTTNNLLAGGFDTNLLANGTYVLKLTVTDTIGETFEDRSMFNVARALITNLPVKNEAVGINEPLFFETYDIRGMATGPGFISYHLEYGLGLNPSEWFRASTDIFTSVENGILFDDFDFTTLPNGTLTLKVVVLDSIVGISEYAITIDNDSLNFPYQQGFPTFITDVYGFSSPAIADIDNDGSKEVVIGAGSDALGYLYAFASDGSQRFKVHSGPIKSAPAIGNLDADAQLEIGVKVIETSTQTEKVLIYNHDGSPLSTWVPPSFSLPDYNTAEQMYVHSSVVFADIDNDGRDDIIFGTAADGEGRVFVLRADSTPLPGWEGGLATSARVAITPVVGDLNNDGSLEVIARDKNNNLYVWNSLGQLLWSKKESGTYRYNCRLALADMNDDGLLDIVSSTYPAGISVWDHQGGAVLSKSYPTWLEVYSFSIGDLDGDAKPEIVVPGMGYDYDIGAYFFIVDCIKADGQSLTNWPVNVANDVFGGYPIIADINNDGAQEILFSFYGRSINEIVAYSADGTEVTGDNWPIRKTGYYLSSMAVDDLDSDGDIEIVFHGSSSRKLRVWDLPSSFSPDKADWPMFQQNSANTGAFQKDVDGDGYWSSIDCNDYDPDIHPLAQEDCYDGVDNNCNGLVDTDDPDAVNCPLICTDADNDLFNVEGGGCGPVDCNDSDLFIFPGANEICTNGTDNDCDGFIGSADDDCSCTAYTGKGTCNTDPFCTWQGSPKSGSCIDNVSSCTPTSSDEVGLCGDGIDNDCDDLVDADDPDCSGQNNGCVDYTVKDLCNSDPSCAWSGSPKNGTCVEDSGSCDPTSSDEIGLCSDGLDNDCDSLIDASDPDCEDPGNTGTEGKGDTCSDGVDNDSDGLVDCADPDCSKNKACK